MTSAYFTRLGDDRYLPSTAVEGAWNPAEQHIAPVLGLLAHALEQQHADGLLLSRISFDILGPLPIEEVAVRTRVLRAGRTIRLVEGELSHGGRPAVLARAWFVHRYDTADLTGSDLPAIPPAADADPYDPSLEWPGAFLQTFEVRRIAVRPGRGVFWLRPRLALIDGEEATPTARMLGVIDVANGMNVRTSPESALYPNLDLTASVFRTPVGEWIGGDTTVSFGPDGRGVTSSALYDESGPIGVLSQSLTVRPRTAS